MPAYLLLWPNLHKIYFTLAISVVFCFTFITPPFQVADEQTHFLRTVHVAMGNLFAEERESQAGGNIPTSAQTMANDLAFQECRHHPEKKISPTEIFHSPSSVIKWGNSTVFAEFAPTAIYPFCTYLPAAVGLQLGKQAHLTVLMSFYMGRLFNAFIYTLISMFAIKYISRGKYLAFALLLMPMTLFQFASFSQDGAIIACTALGVAMINLILDVPANKNIIGLLCVSIFLFFLAAIGRPPYLPFLFLPPLLLANNDYYFKVTLSIAIFFCGVVFLWIMMVQPLFHYFPTLTGTNFVGQFYYLINNPFDFPFIFVQTIFRYHYFLFRSFIGYFGWFDAPLSNLAYLFFCIGLFWCVFIDANSRGERLPTKKKMAIMACCFITVFAIAISLYLSYTPIGKSVIEGIQGRYLIPVALLLTLVLRKNDMPKYGQSSNIQSYLIYGAPILIFFIMGIISIYTVIMRYYY